MEKNQSKVKPLDWTKKTKGNSYPIFFIFLIVALLVGIGGGYLISRYGPKSVSPTSTTNNQQATTKGFGIADKKEFPDQVEGTLKAGGIEGEGNFHLERSGGDSQNVYLTSSTVDLTKFLDKKVRVWGKTFKGEKAGWLMDVGFVENL